MNFLTEPTRERGAGRALVNITGLRQREHQLAVFDARRRKEQLRRAASREDRSRGNVEDTPTSITNDAQLVDGR